MYTNISGTEKVKFCQRKMSKDQRESLTITSEALVWVDRSELLGKSQKECISGCQSGNTKEISHYLFLSTKFYQTLGN